MIENRSTSTETETKTEAKTETQRQREVGIITGTPSQNAPRDFRLIGIIV